MRSILPLLFLGVLLSACLVGAAGKQPPFTVERWVNSMPLTADALRGKVVLLDIWQYTCINWIRTSPYVKAWHRDYAALGLVVVGLHAPEFEFGKRADNIDRGIRDHGLTYPIALDNDFATWRALGNDAWPAKYLYDGQGRLVKRWVGEGRYDEIEEEIRRQLFVAKPATRLNRWRCRWKVLDGGPMRYLRRKSTIARSSCSTEVMRSSCKGARTGFGSCWFQGSRCGSPWRGTAQS
jgi:hypothetical protein